MTEIMPTSLALRIDTAARPSETWDAPERGTLTWRSLLSQGQTPSVSLVCGVADIRPGQHFAAHRPAESEVYFGLKGEGVVIIDGVAHRLSPGVLLFIPGWAEHGIPAVDQPLQWFYAFACDSFDQIAYHFAHEDPASTVGKGQI